MKEKIERIIFYENKKKWSLKMKKRIVFTFGILINICFLFVNCSIENIPGYKNKGHKILIVRIQGESVDDYDDISDEYLIKNALDKGGYIFLNVDIIRKMDNEFDYKYTTLNSNGQFFTKPAILNFVGGQGWQLLQIFGFPGDPQYIFVKPRI